jgi:hypothetical protein
LKEYVPIGPRTGALVGIRQAPPTKVLVVVAVTLQPVTISVDVEKQLVTMLPEAEAVLHSTRRSVTVRVMAQLEVELELEDCDEVEALDAEVWD